MLKKLALLIALGCACVSAQDAWKPLAFLIGTWEGRTAGGTTGTYSFQPELHDHILARHSITCKDCVHSDLLYVYQDPPNQSYKAIYFDNEGHVIHYDVTTPTPTSAVFLSDPSQPGAQYRLTYELKDSTMHGKFQMKLPGQTEFKSYLEWSGAKIH